MSAATVKVLEKARAFIAEPEHWTKGSFARNAAGKITESLGPAVRSMCALGAVSKAGYDLSVELYSSRDMLVRALPRRTQVPSAFVLAEFNDHPSTTHADVLALFDRAIALAKEA